MRTTRLWAASMSILAVLLLVGFSTLGGWRDGTVSYTQGLKCLEQHDLDTALVWFERAVKDRDVRAQARDKRGLICLAKGDFEAAVQDFGEVIATKDGNTDDERVARAAAYNNRGVAHLFLAHANRDATSSCRGYKNLEAARLYDEHIDAAMADFTEAILIRADLAEAYCNRGIAYEFTGNHRMAVQNYAVACDKNPQCAEALFSLGVAHRVCGDIDNAVTALGKATNIDPMCAKAWNTLGRLHVARGDFGEAAKEFTKTLESMKSGRVVWPDVTASESFNAVVADFHGDVEHSQVLLNRGIAYRKTQEFDQAIADLTKVVAVEPDNAMAYYHRGLAYAASEDYAAALSDFGKVIGTDPDHAEAYHARGMALQRSGKPQEAEEDFKRAAELSPEFIRYYPEPEQADLPAPEPISEPEEESLEALSPPDEPHRIRGYTHLANQEFDKAIQEFAEAININPKCAEYYYGRGLAFLKRGFPDTALEDFKQALFLNPDSAEAHHGCGQAYAGTGGFFLAIHEYTEAIRRNPRSATAYYDRGLAYMEREEYSTAIADFNEAARLAPEKADQCKLKLAEAYVSRAAAHTRRKEFAEAVDDYTEAIRIDPKDRTSYYERGHLYDKRGEKEKAAADFAEADRLQREALEPDHPEKADLER